MGRPSNAAKAAAAAAAAAGGEAGETVKVRCLQDCSYGNSGELGEVPVVELAGAKEFGLVDDHPDAVAYAEAQEQAAEQAAQA